MMFHLNNVNSFTSEWRRFSYGDYGHNQTTWWWARKLFGRWRWCNNTAGYGSIQDHQWRQKGTIAWPACSPVTSIVRPSQNGRKRLFSHNVLCLHHNGVLKTQNRLCFHCDDRFSTIISWVKRVERWGLKPEITVLFLKLTPLTTNLFRVPLKLEIIVTNWSFGWILFRSTQLLWTSLVV